MSSLGKMRWCERCVYLDGQPIRFDGRPYLPTIYDGDRGNLVLRCSRQTEKSTLLCNTIVYELSRKPSVRILLVTPREEQGRTFVRTRLLPAIERSPLIRRHLLGRNGRRPQVTNMQFANGSQFYLRAAYHSADSLHPSGHPTGRRAARDGLPDATGAVPPRCRAAMGGLSRAARCPADEKSIPRILSQRSSFMKNSDPKGLAIDWRCRMWYH